MKGEENRRQNIVNLILEILLVLILNYSFLKYGYSDFLEIEIRFWQYTWIVWKFINGKFIKFSIDNIHTNISLIVNVSQTMLGHVQNIVSV